VRYLCVSVFAETISFKADLKASEAVPPNDSKGAGTVTATYDTASKKLTWKGNYSGLTGPATMAHFHGPAEPGKNAGVAVPITPSTSPFENSANLTEPGAPERPIRASSA
jgi:CHRD domain